jgi:U3 small nucleolar RNA-associated protein 19
MLEAELNKEIKKAPVVEYEIPKRIFTKYEPDSGMEDSLLVKVIDFS